MSTPEKEYLVSTWLPVHKLGSKFYEITQIETAGESTRAPARKLSVRGSRWGKVAMQKARGGGEVLVKPTETHGHVVDLRRCTMSGRSMRKPVVLE